MNDADENAPFVAQDNFPCAPLLFATTDLWPVKLSSGEDIVYVRVRFILDRFMA